MTVATALPAKSLRGNTRCGSVAETVATSRNATRNARNVSLNQAATRQAGVPLTGGTHAAWLPNPPLKEDAMELPRATAKLAAWYEQHGESPHVGDVEQALTDDWQNTTELAAASGKSRNYVATLMPYLHAESRADRRQAELEKPIRAQTWQWEWRRP